MMKSVCPYDRADETLNDASDNMVFLTSLESALCVINRMVGFRSRISFSIEFSSTRSLTVRCGHFRCKCDPAKDACGIVPDPSYVNYPSRVIYISRYFSSSFPYRFLFPVLVISISLICHT